MRRILASVLAALALASAPAEPTSTVAEVTELLTRFLAGASRDDRAMHERFWADELVYTGSAGRRIGKADILRELSSETSKDEPKTIYTAEEVRVQDFGETAVVTFRLVGTTEHAGTTFVTRYLNTGTFRSKNGEWRAVAWQATKAALDGDQAKTELLALEKTWNEAHLRGDADALERLWAEDLVVTVPHMPSMSRDDALSIWRSGRMRFDRYETSDVDVALHGESAIVTGRLVRSRTRDGKAVIDDYRFTKTYMRTATGWKVVTFHASESPAAAG